MKISLREKLYDIIFEADTPAGKLFDVVLLVVILISILLVILESVSSFSHSFRHFLKIMEWLITAVFTLEYAFRIWVVKKPRTYLFSFFGIIDLLAILPSYLGLFLAGGQSMMVIRGLRLLRVFRVLKLNRYSQAGRQLRRALYASRAKISVFLFVVINIVLIMGTLMYLIEGPENGYTSIPASLYWAIVTLTTVGYGDISPMTATGQFLASLLMITGYAIIAVPTGIVTAEIIRESRVTNTQVCPHCLHDRHDDEAVFCQKCGGKLNSE